MQLREQRLSVRDNQRQRVYDAERLWKFGFDGFPAFTGETNPPFESLDDIAQFYGRVLKAKRVLKRWPCLRNMTVPKVEPGNGTAAYGFRRVKFTILGRTLKSALHELAHVIHDRVTISHVAPSRAENSRWHEAHGYEFCRIYLDLVLLYMGRDMMLGLKAAFKRERVRYKAPRKITRQMTPEQRAACAERLRRVRPASPQIDLSSGAFCPVPWLINQTREAA